MPKLDVTLHRSDKGQFSKIRRRRSASTSILSNNQTNAAGNSSMKNLDPSLKLTTPEKSQRKNYGTAMGDLEDFIAEKKKTTKESLLDEEVTKVVNRNKINEVAKKKKHKLKTTTIYSSAETDAINMPAVGSSAEGKNKLITDSSAEMKITVAVGTSVEKNKLKQRSHFSTERFGKKKIDSSTEKKNKRDPGAYRDKNHNFWEESDFDQRSKRKPERYSSNEKKSKFGTGKDAFIESTEEKSKGKPERYSSTEKTDKTKRVRYSSDEKTMKPKPERYLSNEKSLKPKLGRYSSAEKKIKPKPGRYSSAEKVIKPKPGKYSSNEKPVKSRPGTYYGNEKTNKPRPEIYSSNEKSNKLRPQKYSSAEKTNKLRPLKYSNSAEKINHLRPLKNKPRQGRDSSNENTKKPRPARDSSNEQNSSPRPKKQLNAAKNSKSVLARDSSTEKRLRDRYSSSEKRNKPHKYSDEELDKGKRGSDFSREKRKKRFQQESREREEKMASYEKLSRTKAEVYSEVESKMKNPMPDSESSFENPSKPSRMGKSRQQNTNKLGASDSIDERDDNKLEASDRSEDVKLRQPSSSVSVEEVTTTRKPTTRWKPRNLGREKYLYKRKKALRSTKMSKFYQDQKLDDKGAINDATNGTGGDLMDKFIDPYLSPYSCAVDFEQAALQVEGLDSAQTEVIGRTAEYNDIVMLKLKGFKDKSFRFRADAHEDKYLDEPPEKKIVFIVHGLSVYGMLNVECLSKMRRLKTLLSYYAKHLDKFDIYLIPLANPDGFTYAQQVKLWSKNRSPQALCPGVQVDRNFEVAWKDNPNINSCDQHYPGPTPFSEAESRAIRDVLHKHGQRMIAYINVHSSSEDSDIFKGDAVLYPKGYADSNEESDRYLDLQGEIEEMMRNASFRHLSVHVNTLKEWYGKVRGTSVDYASSVYGVPYALEFVMQPYPDNRFLALEPNYSKLALEQIWQRVIDVVFNNINNNHQDQVGFKKL